MRAGPSDVGCAVRVAPAVGCDGCGVAIRWLGPVARAAPILSGADLATVHCGLDGESAVFEGGDQAAGTVPGGVPGTGREQRAADVRPGGAQPVRQPRRWVLSRR